MKRCCSVSIVFVLQVLNASASLTEEQKIAAEFFDNKLTSLGASAFLLDTNGLTDPRLVTFSVCHDFGNRET